MISFRTRDDKVASSLLICGVIILLIALIWMLIPAPTVAGVANGKSRSKRQYESETKTQKERIKQLTVETEPLIWVGEPQEVGPKALASVTALAKSHKVEVSFRPQKTLDIGGMTQLPYSVSVSGTYGDTVALIRDLQNPKHRLAISLVQLTSADSASDAVSGIVNVVAYLKVEAAPSGTQSAKKS